METPTLLFMLPAALIVGFFAAWLWLSAKLNHVKENAAADQLRQRVPADPARGRKLDAVGRRADLDLLFAGRQMVGRRADHR